MIDFHQLIINAIFPVKVRSREAYLYSCTKETDSHRFEVADIPSILADTNKGTGVVENPNNLNIRLFHLGLALMTGPRKINSLPSACDLIMHTDKELIIAELTESNARSVTGVIGGRKPGKMEKARNQLQATASFIEKTGYDVCPMKKTAIFFFRLPASSSEVAARSINAFKLRPTLQRVTTYTDPVYPNWEFRNHPYPFSYTIS